MSEYRRYYIKGGTWFFHGEFTQSSKPTLDHPVPDAP
ncbi:Uncharacterised protein [Escherichia coli]|nr:Uncharacterised protein [Escherichia coli]